MSESIRQVLREHVLLSGDALMRQRVDKILKLAAKDADKSGIPELAAWFRDGKVYKNWYKRITALLDDPQAKTQIKKLKMKDDEVNSQVVTMITLNALEALKR